MGLITYIKNRLKEKKERDLYKFYKQCAKRMEKVRDKEMSRLKYSKL